MITEIEAYDILMEVFDPDTQEEIAIVLIRELWKLLTDSDITDEQLEDITDRRLGY